MKRIIGFAAVVAFSLPFAAEAQTYRCTGKDGKKYYGATIPPQCIGVTVEQISPQGVVVRRIEGQMSPEEKAKREAEAKAAAEREDQAKEEARRSRALLAAYQSEADVEAARKRALEENEKGAGEIVARIAQNKKKLDGFNKEMEFYQGKNKPPAKLVDDIKETQASIKEQEALLAKKRDVSAINAKYDDDKRRFQELQKAGGVVPAAAPAAAPAKGADKKK